MALALGRGIFVIAFQVVVVGVLALGLRTQGSDLKRIGDHARD